MNLNNFINNIPTRRDETWKYTNLNFFFKDQKELVASNESNIEFNETENFYELNITNSPIDLIKNEFVELSISDFSTKTFGHGNIENDKTYTDLVQNIKSQLNITVLKEISKPLKINRLFKGENTFIYTALNIESKVQKVDILEHFKSLDDNKLFISNSTNVNIDKNQIINHTSFQDLNKKSLLINNTTSFLEKDSTYENINIHKGSRVTRHNAHSEINQSNATTSVHGLYVIGGDTHIDTNSFIYHNAAHTFSNQLYKTVLDDSSRGVFTGLIRVEKDAQLIESKQLNKNLLLTKKAQANSRPQLEIYADDVKCAHGSTTGQINEDELFYFESRGINKNKARSILAKAFINEVVFKIQNNTIKKFITKEIMND